MCTGLTLVNGDFYFGRNLDLDYEFGQQVVITPKNYPLTYKKMSRQNTHLALIGMASVVDGYPLYAEAVNEAGVGIAGLNFPGFASYATEILPDKDNVTPYELPLYLLSQCHNIAEVKEKLTQLNMVAIDFKPQMPCATLHWLIADCNQALVLEVIDGVIKVYDNPVGILTNSPSFDYHLMNLHAYLGISPKQPEDQLVSQDLKPYGEGLGTRGLPGDFSPASRFIKAAYLKNNVVCENNDDIQNITEFFHILDSVAFVKGATITKHQTHDITLYSCCINASQGKYYYKTYTNNQINCVSLKQVDLQSSQLYCYPLQTKQQIAQIN